MSRPEPRLVAKIVSLPAVQAMNIAQVYPLKIPEPGAGGSYPGIVYQLLEDKGTDDSMGRSAGEQCKIRVSCLARESTGQPGYAAVKAMALAIEGNADPDTTEEPTGIRGWVDDEGNVWLKENSFDEMGTIIEGTDQFEAFIVSIIFTTAYSNQ